MVFACIRAVRLFLRARVVIKFVLRAASILENTDGEQRALTHDKPKKSLRTSAWEASEQAGVSGFSLKRRFLAFAFAHEKVSTDSVFQALVALVFLVFQWNRGEGLGTSQTLGLFSPQGEKGYGDENDSRLGTRLFESMRPLTPLFLSDRR